MIAVEERALKGLLTSRVGFKDGDTLAIGDRAATIDETFEPPVIAHLAEVCFVLIVLFVLSCFVY